MGPQETTTTSRRRRRFWSKATSLGATKKENGVTCARRSILANVSSPTMQEDRAYISTNCLVKGKVFITCGEEGHMKVKCPNAEKRTPKILPARSKCRSYQLTLNEAKEETDVASGAILLTQIPTKILCDSGQITPLNRMNLVEKLSYHYLD